VICGAQAPGENDMQKITPFFWFNDNAEEAVNYYVSIFKNSRVGTITRYDEEAAKVSGKPAGTVMTLDFQLEGQDFTALNGGPQFKFTEAVSFMVNCETQEEIDELWEKLTAGGEEGDCGWLKDKFGLSWQITPIVLIEMLADRDAEKSKRVMQAMLKMKKLDIATLKQAYEEG
jgi:predicted 3-demethylubiquinone-9 3-methyltransferase (glyoxalase superfamily)